MKPTQKTKAEADAITKTNINRFLASFEEAIEKEFEEEQKDIETQEREKNPKIKKADLRANLSMTKEDFEGFFKEGFFLVGGGNIGWLTPKENFKELIAQSKNEQYNVILDSYETLIKQRKEENAGSALSAVKRKLNPKIRSVYNLLEKEGWDAQKIRLIESFLTFCGYLAKDKENDRYTGLHFSKNKMLIDEKFIETHKSRYQILTRKDSSFWYRTTFLILLLVLLLTVSFKLISFLRIIEFLFEKLPLIPLIAGYLISEIAKNIVLNEYQRSSIRSMWLSHKTMNSFNLKESFILLFLQKRTYLSRWGWSVPNLDKPRFLQTDFSTLLKIAFFFATFLFYLACIPAVTKVFSTYAVDSAIRPFSSCITVCFLLFVLAYFKKRDEILTTRLVVYENRDSFFYKIANLLVFLKFAVKNPRTDYSKEDEQTIKDKMKEAKISRSLFLQAESGANREGLYVVGVEFAQGGVTHKAIKFSLVYRNGLGWSPVPDPIGKELLNILKQYYTIPTEKDEGILDSDSEEV